MLIDEFMPEFDFSEKHETGISAPAEKVFAAIQTFDMSESPVIRGLFCLRGLPTEDLTLSGMRKLNFEILGESENEEILIGLAGRFWSPFGSMQKVNAANFREFNKKGFAKATFNFVVVGVEKNKTRLKTETRIQAMDETSRSSFGFYWMFVRPFSGWTREEMLRLIKRRAESGAG